MKLPISKVLRKLRHDKNLTQEELASVLGVTFQSISRWENGIAYPDIEMIPVLASFFGVTTDYILGTDESKQEKEIQEYIDTYYRLWQEAKYEDVLKVMKRAVKNYPVEHRLLVRYLNALIWCASPFDDRSMSVKNEVETIYDRITDFCTTDSIRIWAKKLMCGYYKRLCTIEESGIEIDDVEKILSEMPLMQNCRDYLSHTIYPVGEAKENACRKTISELAYLLSNTIRELVSQSTDSKERIKILNTAVSIFKAMFPDGDYGKSTINIAHILAECGLAYAETGNIQESEKLLECAMETAKNFDGNIIDIEHTSSLIKGLIVAKKDIPIAQTGKLSDRIKTYIDESK